MSLPADPSHGAIITAAALALAGAHEYRIPVPRQVPCPQCGTITKPVAIWVGGVSTPVWEVDCPTHGGFALPLSAMEAGE